MEQTPTIQFIWRCVALRRGFAKLLGRYWGILNRSKPFNSFRSGSKKICEVHGNEVCVLSVNSQHQIQCSMHVNEMAEKQLGKMFTSSQSLFRSSESIGV
ncbi:predicted protein [Histoplasma capsulatum var. duboisii H88]|uniref:Predicted protein n=2 Tax=Ajellomyces capsulatus TaxID=5037 RepID=F0UMZ4_AJEC8|nr:predicted protein [Histoplasma capsulatum H143]EGC47461.1 predicted protein [Histoplasma capsulatum var. duboisii H88]